MRHKERLVPGIYLVASTAFLIWLVIWIFYFADSGGSGIEVFGLLLPGGVTAWLLMMLFESVFGLLGLAVANTGVGIFLGGVVGVLVNTIFLHIASRNIARWRKDRRALDREPQRSEQLR